MMISGLGTSTSGLAGVGTSAGSNGVAWARLAEAAGAGTVTRSWGTGVGVEAASPSLLIESTTRLSVVTTEPMGVWLVPLMVTLTLLASRGATEIWLMPGAGLACRNPPPLGKSS